MHSCQGWAFPASIQTGKSRMVIAVVRERRFLINAETHLASWPDYERDFNRIIDSFRVPEQYPGALALYPLQPCK